MPLPPTSPNDTDTIARAFGLPGIPGRGRNLLPYRTAVAFQRLAAGRGGIHDRWRRFRRYSVALPWAQPLPNGMLLSWHVGDRDGKSTGFCGPDLFSAACNSMRVKTFTGDGKHAPFCIFCQSRASWVSADLFDSGRFARRHTVGHPLSRGSQIFLSTAFLLLVQCTMLLLRNISSFPGNFLCHSRNLLTFCGRCLPCLVFPPQQTPLSAKHKRAILESFEGSSLPRDSPDSTMTDVAKTPVLVAQQSTITSLSRATPHGYYTPLAKSTVPCNRR